MNILLALAVLLCQQDENPLVPKYPFKSVKITYKKTDKIDGIAWISGVKQYMKWIHMRDGKVEREDVNLSDGTYFYDVEIKGARREANKQWHRGARIKADFAALDEADRKKFAGSLEKLWNRWSPTFALDFLDDKIEVKLPREEKVCGRDCQVVEIAQFRATYWRWKGTDIVLKMESGGVVLEAEKIEENVAVPDDVFKAPADAEMDDVGAFDLPEARQIFKMLCGREAKADPRAVAVKPATIKVDGKTITLKDVTFQTNETDDGNFAEIRSEGQPWSLEMRFNMKKAGRKDLAGKTFTLKGEDEGFVAIVSDKVRYVTKEATIKVVAVSDRAITLAVSGKWMKIEEQDEGDPKKSDMKVDDFEITATGE